MSEHIAFTPLTIADREPIARLLHRALVHWYESRLGQGSRFGDRHEPFTLFPDVYESLDPGECVTARTPSGEIVGVCFSHERETHVSVGIERVRDAVLADAPRIADFEHAQQGIRREKDFLLFIRNNVGAWRLLVSEAADGSVNGFLAMSTHPSFMMIGPGVAADEQTALALLW